MILFVMCAVKLELATQATKQTQTQVYYTFSGECKLIVSGVDTAARVPVSIKLNVWLEYSEHLALEV